MIVKMLHLDLVCLAAEKTATLEKLRDLGAVHLDLASAQGASVSAAKGEAADAERAVRLILKARGKSTDFDIHERTVAPAGACRLLLAHPPLLPAGGNVREGGRGRHAPGRGSWGTRCTA